MLVMYVKLRAIFQPNGGCIDFFVLKWDQNPIFGFLYLIKPDSDRITTFEHSIGKKRGDFTVCQPSWIFKPCINLRST